MCAVNPGIFRWRVQGEEPGNEATVLVHQHFSPYIFYGEYQTSEAYNILIAAPFPFHT